MRKERIGIGMNGYLHGISFLRSTTSFPTVRIIRSRSRTVLSISRTSLKSHFILGLRTLLMLMRNINIDITYEERDQKTKSTSQTFVVVITSKLDVIVFARTGLLVPAKRIRNTVDIVFTLGKGFWKKKKNSPLC